MLHPRLNVCEEDGRMCSTHPWMWAGEGSERASPTLGCGEEGWGRQGMGPNHAGEWARQDQEKLSHYGLSQFA